MTFQVWISLGASISTGILAGTKICKYEQRHCLYMIIITSILGSFYSWNEAMFVKCHDNPNPIINTVLSLFLFMTLYTSWATLKSVFCHCLGEDLTYSWEIGTTIIMFLFGCSISICSFLSCSGTISIENIMIYLFASAEVFQIILINYSHYQRENFSEFKDPRIGDIPTLPRFDVHKHAAIGVCVPKLIRSILLYIYASQITLDSFLITISSMMIEWCGYIFASLIVKRTILVSYEKMSLTTLFKNIDSLFSATSSSVSSISSSISSSASINSIQTDTMPIIIEMSAPS